MQNSFKHSSRAQRAVEACKPNHQDNIITTKNPSSNFGVDNMHKENNINDSVKPNQINKQNNKVKPLSSSSVTSTSWLPAAPLQQHIEELSNLEAVYVEENVNSRHSVSNLMFSQSSSASSSLHSLHHDQILGANPVKRTNTNNIVDNKLSATTNTITKSRSLFDTVTKDADNDTDTNYDVHTHKKQKATNNNGVVAINNTTSIINNNNNTNKVTESSDEYYRLSRDDNQDYSNDGSSKNLSKSNHTTTSRYVPNNNKIITNNVNKVINSIKTTNTNSTHLNPPSTNSNNTMLSSSSSFSTTATATARVQVEVQPQIAWNNNITENQHHISTTSNAINTSNNNTGIYNENVNPNYTGNNNYSTTQSNDMGSSFQELRSNSTSRDSSRIILPPSYVENCNNNNSNIDFASVNSNSINNIHMLTTTNPSNNRATTTLNPIHESSLPLYDYNNDDDEEIVSPSMCFSLKDGKVSSMAITRDGAFVLVGFNSGVIRLFDMTVSEGTNDRLIMTIYVYD